MYNLRYHLVSLVAVFLALAVGLVLGSIAAERGYLDEQQAALIDSLQREFDDLRATNADLRERYDRDHGFAVQVADTYADGLLEDRTILVLSDAGSADHQTTINGAILGAGGNVVSAYLTTPGFGLEDPVLRARLLALEMTSTPHADRDLVGEIARGLAAELTSPAVAGTAYVDLLRDAGVLEMEEWSGSRAMDGVVVSASFDEEPAGEAIRVGAQFASAGARAAGCELSWRETGVVAASLEAGLAAVDHVDLPQGSLSLALILAGRADGYYGIRDEASGIIPPLVFGSGSAE